MPFSGTIFVENADRMTESNRTQMMKDLLAIYYESLRRVKRTNPDASMLDIIADAYRSPAPRFYVTVDSAQDRIPKLIKGKPIHVKNKLRAAMWHEIACRFCEELERHPTWTNAEITQLVLDQQASSFYVSQSHFRNLIYEALNTQSSR